MTIDPSSFLSDNLLTIIITVIGVVAGYVTLKNKFDSLRKEFDECKDEVQNKKLPDLEKQLLAKVSQDDFREYKNWAQGQFGEIRNENKELRKSTDTLTRDMAEVKTEIRHLNEAAKQTDEKLDKILDLLMQKNN